MEQSVERIDLCAAIFGWTTYGSDLGSLDHYFLNFAMAARIDRSEACDMGRTVQDPTLGPFRKTRCSLGLK
ncbi:MAG: hypothetical protein Nkreftii_002750 [Candidatus Nitrospira kreftii]|uniref:Uncharacterized protein n=1 Tax=Candidatus Nitrospira kreftii TaxID=2652173 RepID=A0A7S8FFR0_9BACT|nr:MAG: hypothetical protein Nkreftii_002750 [Candidatus Nitrospira kreftii]